MLVIFSPTWFMVDTENRYEILLYRKFVCSMEKLCMCRCRCADQFCLFIQQISDWLKVKIENDLKMEFNIYRIESVMIWIWISFLTFFIFTLSSSLNWEEESERGRWSERERGREEIRIFANRGREKDGEFWVNYDENQGTDHKETVYLFCFRFYWYRFDLIL